MTWIEPLALETWFVNIFSGTPEIFLSIAILVIAMAAGYFRMPVLIMVTMMGLFLLMFMGSIMSPLWVLILIFGSFAIGITLGRFAER